MNKYILKLKNILAPIFNTKSAASYMLLFAIAIGVATFIENDFGTSSAQKVIFKSWWFELLLIVFSITIVVNIFKFKMIKQKKWTLLIFHSAIVIIIAGAGVTRYFGYEGIMHIRENETSNSFLSANTYLKFNIQTNNKNYYFDEEVLFATLGNNDWHKSYIIGKDLVDITVKKFIPNPIKNLHESPTGKPTLKVVVAGMGGREEYILSKGETERFGNIIYNFAEIEIPGAINIIYKNDSLFFKTDRVFSQMVMATQEKDTIYPTDNYKPLMLRSLYSDGINNFVLPEFTKSGELTLVSGDAKVKASSSNALLMEISTNGKTEIGYVYENKGSKGKPNKFNFSDLNLLVSYGAKELSLPFSIKLKKFIMDKYPGTESASSYASEVQLLDSKNSITKDFRIFMNNILTYNGYRFFQSSFDPDEKGTYLSVNNDFWGTLITYIGYILLTIGMILTLLNKKTRFYQLSQNIKKLRKSSTSLQLIFLFMLSSAAVFSQPNNDNINIDNVVSLEHANKFSKIVVQDFRGRMKPVHTLSREILRKLSKKESYNGFSAEQIILSMYANPRVWISVKIIKLGKHEDIKRKLGATSNYVSYRDFFSEDGEYKLRAEIQAAYASKPRDRGVYEKELLKIDEKLNILSMIFSGSLLKIVPNTNDVNNTWSSTDNNHAKENTPENITAIKFFDAYQPGLQKAIETNDYSFVNTAIDELQAYQIASSGKIIPSKSKINAEIFLNNFNIFSRLSLVYIILGLAFLFFLFLSVFRPKINLDKAYKILFAIVILGFASHTIGLGLRWYVSGRAPWSNGYESMIYIAWTSTLAGILFSRKSFGGLAATMVLASTILLVSTLSSLDPEITPLVPVLKSYWLTIHVSLEAGSYGFLLLGAIIGLINMTMMVFLNESNKYNIKRIIQEMSYISEMTLIGGLFMLSIGTYLGGVWANESWGRYWGWDAKETWALVSILVYAFILHMRLIPKLKGLYAYNLATIFGLGSVIMTYYGVNYYLSGLHSYASGDPVPIPNWVYIFTICIIILSTIAYFIKRKFKIIS